MKKYHLIVLSLFTILICSCKPTSEQLAQQLVDEAQILIEDGAWRQAMIVLDSVHTLYPQQVAQRRQAKALSDSISYLEAQRTISYCDTLLPPLLEKVDKVLKNFTYEKNENYEDHGKYVHKLLKTNSNTSRNFIQAYVQDDRETIIKSYYYGNKLVEQQSLQLQANEEKLTFSGSNYSFESEGFHEIMTIEGEQALSLLNFISTHHSARIRVEGIGKKSYNNWVYYLNDNDKNALSDTYQLGWLMKDIKHIEQMQQTANKQILYYQQKYR